MLLLTTVVVGACSTAVTGTPVAATDSVAVDPGFVKGSDGGLIDRLAATAVTDIGAYWREAYPATFGRPWQELAGGFYSVDTTDRGAKPPPCASQAIEVEGNAFYCASVDAIAWDRSALLPWLREKYGEAAVVLVLAHEVGHAVHHRAGVGAEEQRKQPELYPTILMEAMADCYAGSFVRWVSDGKAPHLRVGADQLDSALRALISFRDPVGTSETDDSAHGNAFDRVSAFQDGYREGPGLCGQMTMRTRQFTQRAFTDFVDHARGGNLPFKDMLDAITPNMSEFFGGLVTRAGKTWRAPLLARGTISGDCGPGDQGPIAYCQDGSVALDATRAGELHTEIGDYATGTLLATRYGIAALAALGRPVGDPPSGQTALCLAGAYTGSVLHPSETSFGLSPGDLDEAVQVLLGFDYASRDTGGHGLATGFERVGTFRTGTLRGAAACGVS
ncbi:putative metalloprotease [Crossiella equi]|uniref:Metalloprotease n=1 Tax=Crossiella equi TaxID=130796 RepID=A0ABS5AJX5_9PSEU|nr:neutral zinc metallopeptidase [Crossiella equi]MBP2476863.1 putative metalloprotease [Crossiella equi]